MDAKKTEGWCEESEAKSAANVFSLCSYSGESHFNSKQPHLSSEGHLGAQSGLQYTHKRSQLNTKGQCRQYFCNTEDGVILYLSNYREFHDLEFALEFRIHNVLSYDTLPGVWHSWKDRITSMQLIVCKFFLTGRMHYARYKQAKRQFSLSLGYSSQ